MPVVRAVSQVSAVSSHTLVALSRSSTLASSRSDTVTSSQSSSTGRTVSTRRSSTTASLRSSTAATYVTTTITSVQSATAASVPQRQSSKFPIGVVIGSVAGGVVVLAILALLGWMYWEKSFRRRQLVRTDDEVVTKNTAKNSDQRTVSTTTCNVHSCSSQRDHTQKFSIRSPEKQPLERNISPDCANEKADTYTNMPNVSTPDSVESRKRFQPPQLVFKPAKISHPRTLRKNKGYMHRIDRDTPLSPIPDVDNEAIDASLELSLADPFADTNALLVNTPASVAHKPSVIGSASVYSTESGEERQYVDDSSATHSPPGLNAHWPSIPHKPSNISSIYSSQSGEERDFGAPSNFSVPLGQDRRRFSAHTHNSALLHWTSE